MERELIKAEMEQILQRAKEMRAAKIQESRKQQEKDEPNWVYQLRDEIKQLRAEVKELKEKIDGNERRAITPD
jgi:hypothetical protein